jgi:hypothetical protein
MEQFSACINPPVNSKDKYPLNASGNYITNPPYFHHGFMEKRTGRSNFAWEPETKTPHASATRAHKRRGGWNPVPDDIQKGWFPY